MADETRADDVVIGDHTFRRRGDDGWYLVWSSLGQAGFTPVIDHSPSLKPFLDEIERLRNELAWTRRSWVAGDDPMCEDVCLEVCQGPCGAGDTDG